MKRVKRSGNSQSTNKMTLSCYVTDKSGKGSWEKVTREEFTKIDGNGKSILGPKDVDSVHYFYDNFIPDDDKAMLAKIAIRFGLGFNYDNPVSDEQSVFGKARVYTLQRVERLTASDILRILCNY